MGEPRSIHRRRAVVEAGRVRRLLRRAVAYALVLTAVLVPLRLTGCMERLFYYPLREPTPPPRGYAGAERVRFESADGTALHGWFIPAQPPREQRPGAAAPAAPPALAAPAAPAALGPAILHVHGNAGNVNHHFGFTDYLPAAGFAVFIFDYRGYGESAGKARRREPLIADTRAALDALLARSDVDPRRIGMYAQSLGAGIGLSVMADRPEIAAAVIESGFASWRDIAADALGGGPIARLTARLLIRDGSRPEDAIARINRPLLILHGTADAIIPVEHGRRLAAAAPAAELVELEGGGHNTLRESHPGIEHTVIDFFRSKLP